MCLENEEFLEAGGSTYEDDGSDYFYWGPFIWGPVGVCAARGSNVSGPSSTCSSLSEGSGFRVEQGSRLEAHRQEHTCGVTMRAAESPVDFFLGFGVC